MTAVVIDDPGDVMTTVDFRTRLQGSATELDAATFCEQELPSLLAEHGKLAARGVAQLGLIAARVQRR